MFLLWKYKKKNQSLNKLRQPVTPWKRLKNIPSEAIFGLGCGNPTALAEINQGEVVLDLGSGGGIDVFLAANKVGEDGKVIGVDMTPEMIETALKNAKKEDIKMLNSNTVKLKITH